MKKSLVEEKGHFTETHARWLQYMNHEIDRDNAPDDWFAKQCLHCAYFVPLVGAFAEDWGVCSHRDSPRDGRATFEHDGCDVWEEVEEPWQSSK